MTASRTGNTPLLKPTMMTQPRSLANRAALLLVCLGLTVSGACAQKFKVATVDMGRLITQFYRYQDAQKEQAVEVEKIREGDEDRLAAIKALTAELENMIKEMNDPSLAANRRNTIREQAKGKRADLQNLEGERQQFVKRRDQALAQKMASLQNDITEEVIETVNAYAETQDVDYVFDESAVSRSEVPFLIYVRNKVDLTEAVLKILNKDAPEGYEPGEPDANATEKE